MGQLQESKKSVLMSVCQRPLDRQAPSQQTAREQYNTRMSATNLRYHLHQHSQSCRSQNASSCDFLIQEDAIQLLMSRNKICFKRKFFSNFTVEIMKLKYVTTWAGTLIVNGVCEIYSIWSFHFLWKIYVPNWFVLTEKFPLFVPLRMHMQIVNKFEWELAWQLVCVISGHWTH